MSVEDKTAQGEEEHTTAQEREQNTTAQGGSAQRPLRVGPPLTPEQQLQQAMDIIRNTIVNHPELASAQELQQLVALHDDGNKSK
ncbi:unnamed protein product [Adineta steineri]|uniref:Uncharacterized protein n=1 Tax=Adineta steineri TaxID=433720 RepID=A0A815V6S2_9BILA|nr:unnamed protein product [Adineta steineri]CAF1526595.1 unnamed protein product [Adineta steineri]